MNCIACTLRKNKETMVKLLKDEYKKRGQPLDSTGWSPKEVRQFMTWQFDVQKPKKKDSIGGFSWLLPEKGIGGRPASMPKEVKVYCSERNIWESNLFLRCTICLERGFNIYNTGNPVKLNGWFSNPA